MPRARPLPAPAAAVPGAAPELDDLLCFAVHATGFAFNRLYRAPLRRLGLTYPQYLVMVALWGEDAVPVGRLCARLALDTSTLTPLLKRLEAMGLLTRRRSETDERRVTVALSPAGRAMRRHAAEVTRCVGEGTGMTPAALARLTGDLRRLRDNLERGAAAA